MTQTPNSLPLQQVLLKGLTIGITIGFVMGGCFGFEAGRQHLENSRT
ncbi:MAG: hypothetical protein AAF978_02300 [Cyanobacteria bacterium P01_E01_bin.48]